MNKRENEILIVVSSDELTALRQEVEALRADLRGVKLTPQPDWVPLKDYAQQIGKTTKTVHNWIKRDEIEIRRQGHGSAAKMMPINLDVSPILRRSRYNRFAIASNCDAPPCAPVPEHPVFSTGA